jgi:hypothetical protein
LVRGVNTSKSYLLFIATPGEGSGGHHLGLVLKTGGEVRDEVELVLLHETVNKPASNV